MAAAPATAAPAAAAAAAARAEDRGAGEEAELVGSAESGGKGVLEPFWAFTEPDAGVRLRAVRELIELPSVRDAASDDHVYAIKRLARGLTSSHGVARQTFAVALTQLLRSVEGADCGAVRKAVLDGTQVSGQVRGLEERERYFGRLFGMMALARSGRVSRDVGALVEMAQACLHVSKQKQWIEEMAVEACCDTLLATDDSVLVELLTRLRAGDKQGKTWNFGVQCASWKDLSAAQLSLVCALDLRTLRHPAARAVLVGAAPPQRGQGQGQQECKGLPLVLPAATAQFAQAQWEDLMEPLRLACHTSPRLHSAWPKLLRWALECPEADFAMTWRLVMDALVVEQSHERRFTFMKALEAAAALLVDRGEPARVGNLLVAHEPVQRLLLAASNKKEGVLHGAAEATLAALGAQLRRPGVGPAARAAVAEALQRGRFIGGRRAAERIILQGRDATSASANASDDHDNAVDVESVRAEMRQLMAECVRANSAHASAAPVSSPGAEEADGSWTVGIMCALARQVRDPQHKLPLLYDLALFLTRQGLFRSALPKPSKGKKASEQQPQPPQRLTRLQSESIKALGGVLAELVSLEVNAMAAADKDPEREQAYWAAATSSNGIKKAGGKSSQKAKGEATDDVAQQLHRRARFGDSAAAVNALVEALRHDGEVELATSTGAEALGLYSQAVALAAALEACSTPGLKERRLSAALQGLLRHLALQLLLLGEAGEEVNVDLAETMGDLLTCARRLARQHDLLPADAMDEEEALEDDEEEEHGAGAPNEQAVLVDLMIAVLAQPSALLRSVIAGAFRCAVDWVNVEALDIIFDVLSTREPDNVAADDDDDGDGKPISDAEESDADDSDEEEEEEEEEDEEDDDEDEEGKAPNKAAPKATSKAAAENASKSESESESESNSDDEENGAVDKSAYDDALAAFVRATIDKRRSGGRAGRNRSETERLGLKLRVLDLVDVLVRLPASSAGSAVDPQRASLLALLPACLMRAGETCLVAGGAFKKGEPGKVAQQLLGRYKACMNALAVQAPKLLEASEAGEAPGLALRSEGACARALRLTEAELAAGNKPTQGFEAEQGATVRASTRVALAQSCAVGVALARRTPNKTLASLATLALEVLLTAAFHGAAQRRAAAPEAPKPSKKAKDGKASASKVAVDAEAALVAAMAAPLCLAASELVANKKTQLRGRLIEGALAKGGAAVAVELVRSLAAASADARRVKGRLEGLRLLTLAVRRIVPLAASDAVLVLGAAAAALAETAKLESPELLRPKNLRVPLRLANELARAADAAKAKVPLTVALGGDKAVAEAVAALVKPAKQLIAADGAKVQRASVTELAQMLALVAGEKVALADRAAEKAELKKVRQEKRASKNPAKKDQPADKAAKPAKRSREEDVAENGSAGSEQDGQEAVDDDAADSDESGVEVDADDDGGEEEEEEEEEEEAPKSAKENKKKQHKQQPQNKHNKHPPVVKATPGSPSKKAKRQT